MYVAIIHLQFEFRKLTTLFDQGTGSNTFLPVNSFVT